MFCEFVFWFAKPLVVKPKELALMSLSWSVDLRAAGMFGWFWDGAACVVLYILASGTGASTF